MQGAPPFTWAHAHRPIFDGCGNYDVWAQMDLDGYPTWKDGEGKQQSGLCFLPQACTSAYTHTHAHSTPGAPSASVPETAAVPAPRPSSLSPSPDP